MENRIDGVSALTKSFLCLGINCVLELQRVPPSSFVPATPPSCLPTLRTSGEQNGVPIAEWGSVKDSSSLSDLRQDTRWANPTWRDCFNRIEVVRIVYSHNFGRFLAPVVAVMWKHAKIKAPYPRMT